MSSSMNHTATTQEPEEQHGVVATLLDVLPVETLSTILRECRLPDICMFSEVSKFANSIAGDTRCGSLFLRCAGGMEGAR